MFPRLVLVAILGGTLAAPALATQTPEPSKVIKPDMDLVLSNGSIAHLSSDGQHLTMLKGGKSVFVPPGSVTLNDGTVVEIGANGIVKFPKHEAKAVAPSHPH